MNISRSLQNVLRLYLARGLNTKIHTSTMASVTVLQTSPAVKQPVLTTAVVHDLIGAQVPLLEDAVGFMAPGPVRNREDPLLESCTMYCPGPPLAAGLCIPTCTCTLALPQALRISKPVRRYVFKTPAARVSTGVQQLRLANVAGFMDLGAALNREEHIRAYNITSCTEAVTDCAVSNST